MRQTDKTNQIILFIILLAATFLRFYQFFDLPFMWDELSAWNRLKFNSLSELIEKGVKPDGHPAGVQVFLYYWTQWFGDKEWIIKLPFNLMGLVSVWLIYKIGVIWFNPKTGLISATFMASLQFFVLYSPIARPYSSGLFLTLMMVLFWSLYMFKTPRRTYLSAFIIFAALSSYNHHFSLLFAAIVGLSGLMVIPRNLLKEYMVSGLLIFVFYIPHMPVFLHQLGVGGIGGEGLWLEKPDWSFIWEFLQWSFQYSVPNYILAGLFTMFSLHYCIKHYHYRKVKKIALLSIWFVFPILIGLGYSILINPVIQYSMLIFSFPYILLLISVFAEKTPKFVLVTIVLGILSINIYQLIIERRHFEIIKKQPFEVTALLAKENPESSFVLFNTIPEYQKYYFRKYNISGIANLSIYNKKFSDLQIDSIIGNRNERILISCGLSREHENIIRRHFPYFAKRENAYTMDCYVFSKDKTDSSNHFSNELHYTDFIEFNENWDIKSERLFEDSLSNKYFEFNANQKWGFKLTDSLKVFPGNASIDFQADIYSSTDIISPLWVFSAYLGDEQIFWRGETVELLKNKEENNYQCYFSIETRWIEQSPDIDSIRWRLYFWNKNENNFKISSLSCAYREANPIKYSLFGKIH